MNDAEKGVLVEFLKQATEAIDELGKALGCLPSSAATVPVSQAMNQLGIVFGRAHHRLKDS